MKKKTAHQNAMKKPYWVGVRKDKFTGHDVFQAAEDEVTSEKYPNYDYTIGPFTKKSAADERAESEQNKTGMFHPFPGHPR